MTEKTALVLLCGTISEKWFGRFVSDHNAVLAEIELTDRDKKTSNQNNKQNRSEFFIHTAGNRPGWPQRL